MNPILALWAVPRSRSSAFSVMMMHRGDFSVVVEPFESSAYYSDQQIVQRYKARGPEYNYDNALQALLRKSETERLFIKDHAYYIIHLADDTFLSYFKHSFLIRHPAQALPSYFDKWPDVSLLETGYKELYELFEKVADRTGETPALIDADDLMEKPEATVKAYCDHVDIPFIEQALNWQPLNQDRGMWHDHLVTTRGFEHRPNRAYLNVEDNEHLKRLYDYCLPYYERLYAHRLAPRSD